MSAITAGPVDLPQTLANDHWPGVVFTIPAQLAGLGRVQFVLVRQASAASEPVYAWDTQDNTITLAPTADGAGTLATVVGRVLAQPGVWHWRLVSGVGGSPRTWVGGHLIVKGRV